MREYVNLGKELIKLRSHLLDARETKKSRRKAKYIDLIVKNQSVKKYVLDDLGVYGGGFALVHEKTESIILLQRALYQLNMKEDKLISNLARIDIPYFYKCRLSNEKIRSSLVDLLFISRRSTQPLSNIARIGDPPEFFQSLPPHKGYLNIDEKLWLEHEHELRKEK
jgi:hypothetical protein